MALLPSLLHHAYASANATVSAVASIATKSTG